MPTPEEFAEDREMVRKGIDRIKSDSQWQLANPDNPICPGCNDRVHPDYLKWPLLNGTKVCADCADDEERRILS